jgi:hypothetical protein
LVKQNVLDGVVGCLAVVLARPGRWRSLALLVAGAMIPVVLTITAAALSGWHVWWAAIVGFQTQVSATTNLVVRTAAVLTNLWQVAPDLLGLGLVAFIAGVVGLASRRHLLPLVAFAAAAVAGCLVGVAAHPHYWVQAVAPLSVLTSVALVLVTREQAAGPSWTRVGVLALGVAVVLAVPVLSQARLLSMTPDQRSADLLHGDSKRMTDGDIAAWLRSHSKPTDNVYVFAAAADVYTLANRHTTYPYLWLAPVMKTNDGRRLLIEMLTGASRPEYVVVYENPQWVDPTGRVQRALDSGYVGAATVDDISILRRR